MNQRKYDWYKIIFCTLLFLVVGMVVVIHRTAVPDQSGTEKSGGTVVKSPIEIEEKQTALPSAAPTAAVTAAPDLTAGIYTFLQGPRSWKGRIPWSGEWGDSSYDGGRFGAFGCGLCCLANIYSSETEYECSPIDMYRYSKKYTEYGGGSAIAWEYMQQVLEKTGFTASLHGKPDSYEKFQEAVASSACNIVLVSSANSKCYWKNTPGHYVTIFLYDRKSDRVFLADSGDPTHNRQRISLKKIYKSLKTDSDYQYLSVSAYDRSRDQWKHKGTAGSWVSP